MSIVMEHERVGEGWVPVLSWSILLSILNFVTIRNIIMSMNYQIFLNWGDVSAITWSSSSSNNLRNAVDLFYASCWACCACWVWFDCFFVALGIVTGNGCCCCCCCWCNSLADCGYWNWFWFYFVVLQYDWKFFLFLDKQTIQHQNFSFLNKEELIFDELFLHERELFLLNYKLKDVEF